MKPDAQRIAIAEACGWRKASAQERENIYGADEWRKDGVRTPSGWRGHYFGELPDYLNDLNAMHEAEKELEAKGDNNHDGCGTSTFDCYRQEIGKTSTAAQRAEAFLRTIGKWEESE